MRRGRTKRYLSGIDWMIGALNDVTRRTTGTGNVSQVVLQLDGAIDPDSFESALRAFLSGYPVISGRCRRGWNLAPYWEIPKRATLDGLAVRCIDLPIDAAPDEERAVLEREANRAFARKRQYLSFAIARRGTQSSVAMLFDHRLLEARGAELFLDRLNAFAHGQPTDDPGVRDVSAHLDHWREKFEAGQRVNRLFLRLRAEGPIRALDLPRTGGAQSTRYAFRSYAPEASARIEQAAERSTGYLMLSNYLLGAAVWALHDVFARHKPVGDHYVVPVNVDHWSGRGRDRELFFNHMSFLYFRFAASIAGNCRALWGAANDQLYEFTKRRVADEIAQASLLMRIVPHRVLGRLIRLPLNGSLGSFSFSYLGTEAYSGTEFMGHPVANLYHMPRVPTPPGLGVFFTRYRGRLNVVLSFLDGMLGPGEAEEVLRRLDEILPAGS